MGVRYEKYLMNVGMTSIGENVCEINIDGTMTKGISIKACLIELTSVETNKPMPKDAAMSRISTKKTLNNDLLLFHIILNSLYPFFIFFLHRFTLNKSISL